MAPDIQLPQIDRLISVVLQSTATETGKSFLSSLVKSLATTLEMRFCVVSEFLGQARRQIRVLALWDGQEFAAPFEYEIAGTPSEVVREAGEVLVLRGAREVFPGSAELIRLQAEAYVGVRLASSTGLPLGVLAVLDTKPLEERDQEAVRQLLRVFGMRAASELERTRALMAREENEARLRALSELSSDWFWEQDENLRFVDTEATPSGTSPRRAAGYHGRARWELYGDSLASERWAAHRRQLEAHEEFRDLEFQRLSRDGVMRWVTVSGRPFYDQDGRFRGYRGIGRDITERKVSEEKLLRFRLAMDYAADMILVIDRATMRYIDANLAVTRLLGYSHDELFAMGPQDILPVSRKEIEESYEALIASESGAGVLNSYFICKDGTHLAFEASRHASRSGDSWIIVAICRDIRQRLAVEQALRESEERFRATFEQAAVGIAHLGPDGRWLRVNERLCEIVGYAREELLARSLNDLAHPDHVQAYRGQMRLMLAGKIPTYSLEMRLVRKDGGRVWIYLTAAPVRTTGKRPDYVIAVVEDIDARKQMEEALRLRDRAIESSPYAVMITDAAAGDMALVYVNSAFEQITGYPATAAIGENPRFLHREDRDQPDLDTLRHAVQTRGACTVLLRNYRADGTLFWNELRVAPIEDLSGRVTHMVGIGNDVTERVRFQEELQQNANFDTLTGLPNRNLLRDRLGQAIAYAERSGRPFALLFIDLDQLKRINDSFGHDTGDKVIVAASKRIVKALRTSDTLARLGGDEFVAVLLDVQDEAGASTAAYKVLNIIGTPMKIADAEFVLTASIGVALCPRDGTDAPELLRNADTALYQAKDNGRNCFRFFETEMNQRVVQYVKVEQDLRRALQGDEFRLAYQPIIPLAGGRPVGAEALIRWRQTDGTVVAPAEFIPVAEESGLIVAIGQMVMERAMLQAADWNRRANRPFYVSVNLSVRQFRDPNLLDAIEASIVRTNVNPEHITFEITESAVMQNAEEAVRVMRALKGLGVKLSLDDFGTGYSSLAYLKRFPIDVLKIDRAFVKELASNRGDQALSRAIIALGRSLSMDIVAEGVETVDQARFLADNGCAFAQGFLYGRPIDAAQFPLDQRAPAVSEIT